MDPATRHRHRSAPRRLRPADGGGHLRHRPADLHLLDRLLRPRQAGVGTTRRCARAVRGSDARSGPVGSVDRSVHLLGADLDHVVPADRQRRHQPTRPGSVDAGDLHHRRRRPRAPRRPDHHRSGRRHVPDVGAARRSAEWWRRQRRDHPRPHRRLHQVGASTVQQLAAGGDGRTHPGERLPALRNDGQGRCLPRRPHGADVRGDGQLAPRGDGDRRVDDDDRRVACVATDRSEAAPRLWHDQPARLHDAVARRRRVPHRRSRPRAGPRPRRVQGGALHGGRHGRSRDRHAGHHRIARLRLRRGGSCRWLRS